MTAPWLPVSLADLDEDWLVEQLASANGWAGLASATIRQLPDGVGFLGDHASVSLRWSNGAADGAPASLIVKLPTSDPGGRAVGELLSVWWREHRFYGDLAERLGVPVPTPRLNLADPERGRYVLALDEVAHDTSVDQVVGATRRQAELAVDTLAHLHGAGADGVLGPVEWLPGIDRAPVEHLQEAIVRALPAWRERFGDRLDRTVVDGLGELAPRLAAFVSSWTGDRLTLAHADFRLDNLLLTESGIVVVDWQTAMRTTGASDLAMFCATSLTVEDRRAWEDELLDRYRAGLDAAGVALDAVLLRRRYDEAFWWWTAMFANNLSSIETDEGRATDLFESMMLRTATAAADHPLGPA